jgi:hypothetical protein
MDCNEIFWILGFISSVNYQSVTVGTSTWSKRIRLLKIVSRLFVYFDNSTGLLLLLLLCHFISSYTWWNWIS